MLFLICVIVFLILIFHGISKHYEKRDEKTYIAIIVISILNLCHLVMLHIVPSGNFYYYLGVIRISYEKSLFLMGSSMLAAAAALVTYVYHESDH